MNYYPPILPEITYSVPFYDDYDNHFHSDCTMHGYFHPLKSVSIHVQDE